MQTIQSIPGYITDHWSSIVFVVTGVCSLLSGILEALGKTGASKVFGTIAIFDFGRVKRWLDWLKLLADARKKAAVKATMGLLTVLLLSGCSHESARARRIATQQDAARRGIATQPRNDAFCQRMDSIHVYGDWTAGVSGAVVTGAGIVASSTDDGARQAAIWTGVGAAAVGAVALGIAEQSASSWVERCQ